MKKFTSLVLMICLVFLLTACGHTQKRPLVTRNAEISDVMSTVVAGNSYLAEQRSWTDWTERVKDKSTVVLKVKKVYYGGK